MDWLNQSFHTIKNKFHMSALRMSLSVHIFIAILFVLLLYALTLLFCDGWEQILYQKYALIPDEAVPLNQLTTLDTLDKWITNILFFFQTYSIVLYSILAIVITSNLFFKNKIQVPLDILTEEAKHISRNDLSFSCSFHSEDEFGAICNAFDKMRLQIVKNQEQIWKLMESQKQVNSAFAHDIRTPLTVIQGYVDTLTHFYPLKKISDDKLLHTFALIQSQLDHMQTLAFKMKDIQDINQIEVKLVSNSFEELGKKLEQGMNGIKGNSSLQFIFQNDCTLQEGIFDEAIILQVSANLLSNALSFAKTKITLLLKREDDFLSLYVKDDGCGFSKKELYAASNAYYSSRTGEDGHYGIGLTVCEILCEKHGGKLSLTNSTHGGAIVCARFFAG